MKRVLSLVLCVVMLCGVLPMLVSAAYFQVSHNYENIYAGGVLDLYAFPNDDGVEPYTYQWQVDAGIGGNNWIDLEDNAVYAGTKTNHMQITTKTGTYEGWEDLPFCCKVTDAEGTVCYTSNIYVQIRSTEQLLTDLKNWGYGLYEPSVSGVIGWSSDNHVDYKGYVYAGNKLNIISGSKPVTDYAILTNSEVVMTRKIHITENGHTTSVADLTTYIPYTIGANAVTIKMELQLSIGKHDLGVFDSKTIRLTTSKPTVTSTAQVNTDCSLLRYTYNESQKLSSIPKGALVEIVGKEGSYYQVIYNDFVGYVGTSLLNVQTPAYDPVIKEVDVTIPAPVAGQTPSFTCDVLTKSCELYKSDPVSWVDLDEDRFLTASDTFQEGHSYSLSIWLSAKTGYKFRTNAAGNPYISAAINGNLPPYVYVAYEQDPEKVVELVYVFNNVKKPPEQNEHVCNPVLVERVEPTCTQAGHEAYYRCSCGMHYEDSQATKPVDISTWGVLEPLGHLETVYRFDPYMHYKICGRLGCGEDLDQSRGYHTGGTATCEHLAVCTVCGHEYGELEDHRWSPTFLYQDSTGHAWICADCKGKSTVYPHTPGPAATEKEPQLCIDCGYILAPVVGHTHSLTKVEQKTATCTEPGNIEYYTCSGCSDRFTDAAGSSRIPDTEDVTVAPLGHTAGEQWHQDDTFHWRSCSTCQTVLEETKMRHDPASGECATCGYHGAAGENAGQDDPAGAKTSADNELIYILVAVGIGLVCFLAAITVTVLMRKKRT